MVKRTRDPNSAKYRTAERTKPQTDDKVLNQDFAAFLRKERHKRKLSQAALAHRAHVSERSVRYWEAGSISPGPWERESLLTALGLSPFERTHALALLPIRPTASSSRESATLLDERGPSPALGDLLQAMRMRRNLTQAQMASELQISPQTISRWEATRVLPSHENLNRVCLLLHAYPEERNALVHRRLHVHEEGNTPLSLEQYAQRINALDEQVDWMRNPLIDLHALALKRQLWLPAATSDEARHLLVRVQAAHAVWLMMQGRNQEAQVCIARSLNLLESRPASKAIWRAVINLAAQFASDSNSSGAGESMIQRWLPAFPKQRQTTLWCDMALYAGRSQQHDLAEWYLGKAQEVLPYDPDAQFMTENYYPLTRAKTLMSAGRPWEALEWLPPIPDAFQSASKRANYQLLWVEAYLDAGETSTAQRNMDELRLLFADYPQPRMERKLYTLAARI